VGGTGEGRWPSKQERAESKGQRRSTARGWGVWGWAWARGGGRGAGGVELEGGRGDVVVDHVVNLLSDSFKWCRRTRGGGGGGVLGWVPEGGKRKGLGVSKR
jgi:hypothetical protein